MMFLCENEQNCYFIWKEDIKVEVLGRIFPIGSKTIEHNNRNVRKTKLKLIDEELEKKVQFGQDIVIESLYQDHFKRVFEDFKSFVGTKTVSE